MTEVQTRVSVKRNDGEIISADVNLYNDGGDVVKRVIIVDSEVLDELEATVENYEANYVSNDQLTNILKNQNEDTTINATKLENHYASDFAEANHLHNNYAPTNHASRSNDYGVGSTSNYGHVKTINNLDTASYISGESLSAYQGALLNNKVNSAQSQIDLVKSNVEKNSMVLKIGRSKDHAGEDKDQIWIGRGTNVYAKLYCDKDISNSWAGKEVHFIINGKVYTRQFDNNGEAEMTISLNTGTYYIQVFCGAIGGVNGANCSKLITVVV